MRSTIVQEESISSGDEDSAAANRPWWWYRLYLWIVQGRRHRVRREQFLALPPAQVFAFFADGASVAPTLPGWLGFQLLSPLPFTLVPGKKYDCQWRFCFRTYRMEVYVVQMQAPALIEKVQQAGPFRVWHSVHKLKPTSGGTWIVDEMEYQLPWGVVGTLLNRIVVRRKLEQLFDYRQSRIIELLLPEANRAAQAPLTRASRARMRKRS